MTRMKKTASGAKNTICRMELTATRMAQYSPSPPAKPVQIKTYQGHGDQLNGLSEKKRGGVG